MATFSEVPETIPATVLRWRDYATSHKTAVVIGLPQGGTSMLAAVVDALGIPMTGDELFNFEGGEERPYIGDDLETWRNKVNTQNERAAAVSGLRPTGRCGAN